MIRLAGLNPKHFLWQVEDKVARVRLDRPERKNPLTFDAHQAIEAEAQAQAICMQTRDFERAYRAFVARQTPVFEGT